MVNFSESVPIQRRNKCIYTLDSLRWIHFQQIARTVLFSIVQAPMRNTADIILIYHSDTLITCNDQKCICYNGLTKCAISKNCICVSNYWTAFYCSWECTVHLQFSQVGSSWHSAEYTSDNCNKCIDLFYFICSNIIYFLQYITMQHPFLSLQLFRYKSIRIL